ncbi:hypothetical protein CO583_01945 [Parasaccharibacter sp. TMW2.1882]|uniref:hypothetical protein n=1 Tax=Parasaccharibacter sp. TMW2.1882 TaxID=2039286 RepID=UPI0020132F35|nr:hypothetical protein [Parasaccharibacter sp. TMW2.1882]MCL1496272.1 hypothetical protein [Parasaccharibacter sp. TMW2.1882]
MPEITREEFEQLRTRHEQLDERHAQTRERVAASEAVQDQQGGTIQRLHEEIADLAREQRAGIAALSDQIRATNSSRSRTLYAAISGGGAVGGAVACGLYQLVHTLYPHFFGG